MAKELSAADVAAFFAAKGLDLPEELTAAIENEKADEAFHRLIKITPEQENEKAPAHTARVSEMQKNLFTLAETIENDWTAETVNQQGRGSGQVVRRQVMIETDQGTLFVRLARPVKK